MLFVCGEKMSVMNKKKQDLKVVVLAYNAQAYFSTTESYLTEVYRHSTENKLFHVLRKLALIVNIGVEKFFLGDWYKKCQEIDVIILFDIGNTVSLLSLLKKNFPHIRLVLWYWNPVEKSIPVHLIDRNKCEVWSYHKNDCEKYKLRYNTQFYIFNENQSNAKNKERSQDIYFVGADKNRSELLHEMTMAFEALGLSYKVLLTPTKTSVEEKIKYSIKIDAQENVKNILESKVILDVVPEEHRGGDSLRPFEAQNYKRKLITNDRNVKSLHFYSSDNIFIWGEDDIDALSQFVDGEYVDCGAALAFYEFDYWLRRFMM